MKNTYYILLIFVVGGFLLVWKLISSHPPVSKEHEKKELTDNKKQEEEEKKETIEIYLGSLRPLPTALKLDEKKVALGNKLFHDRRLSKDNTISCASCHNLQLGGTDRLPTSIGIRGQRGEMNSPTIFNAGFNFKQFWDGRAKDLEEQAEGPVHNPIEMGSNWEEVIGKLSKDTAMVLEFNMIYQDGMTGRNIQNAIAEFEKSLITPNSRFDKYLRGDKKILSEKELKGYQLFEDIGCSTCHQGINIGGNSFQKLGQFTDFFENKKLKKSDYGRFNVTQRERDKHRFKVPSLRNVAITAPYFHDGSVATLEEAVSKMGRYQLGYQLKEEEVSQIAAFLKTLTGEYKGQSLEK